MVTNSTGYSLSPTVILPPSSSFRTSAPWVLYLPAIAAVPDIGNARPILMVSTVSSFFAELQAHMETIMSTARTSANTFFILFLHIFLVCYPEWTSTPQILVCSASWNAPRSVQNKDRTFRRKCQYVCGGFSQNCDIAQKGRSIFAMSVPYLGTNAEFSRLHAILVETALFFLPSFSIIIPNAAVRDCEKRKNRSRNHEKRGGLFGRNQCSGA